MMIHGVPSFTEWAKIEQRKEYRDMVIAEYDAFIASELERRKADFEARKRHK